MTRICDFAGPVVPELTALDVEAIEFDLDAAKKHFSETVLGNSPDEESSGRAATRATAAATAASFDPGTTVEVASAAEMGIDTETWAGRGENFPGADSKMPALVGEEGYPDAGMGGMAALGAADEMAGYPNAALTAAGATADVSLGHAATVETTAAFGVRSCNGGKLPL